MPSTEHEQIVELLTSQPRPENPTLEEQRAGFEQMAAEFPLQARTDVQPVSADGVPADWVQASGADPNRVVLYLHGGGYVLGSRNTHRSLASRISEQTGARVLLLEYRLAPEDPFPAAVEDAVVAYRWVLAQGVQPAHVAIAGDSAGGGLTIAALMSLRDQGLPQPGCGVCLSPWIDLEGTGETAQPGVVDDPMIALDGLQAMAAAYAPDAAVRRDPLAAPLHGDWSGLPPLLIQVGTREMLLDDARRAARMAKEANVDVTLEEEPGLVHVWQIFPGVPEATAAVERIGSFVGRQLS